MSQTFQMLFGRGRHRTNSRSLTNDRGELNTHIPDGPHMTVRQLRRMLDNNLFEAELNPRDENSIPTVERPVVAQNPYSATSESERAGPNEVGALMESNVCSDAPKQTGQMHLLSTFSDVHGGLARLVFELSGVLCGLGDNQEKLMDDYSHVVHECTNFMLDAAIKLQHLQTNLQFSGATPCDAARRTGLNTKPSFTVWGTGENAMRAGRKHSYDSNSDAGTDSSSEYGGSSSSSRSLQKPMSSVPLASSSQPRASVLDSKYRNCQVRTYGALPSISHGESGAKDWRHSGSVPDLGWPSTATSGTLPSIQDEDEEISEIT